jgi:2-amino-4-hydroxy-6-hydroxymethyldihydropteridine diphosphokinase
MTTSPTVDPHAKPDHPVTVFVGIGSNMGDRTAHMDHAFRALASTPGIRLMRQSSVRETAPVGVPGQGPYLNAVSEISTDLSPHALLATLLDIESQRGRDRTREVRFGPRTLDLDMLIWDASLPRFARIDAPGLTVPHPRMHERPFVLLPLAELDPEIARRAAGSPVHFASD